MRAKPAVIRVPVYGQVGSAAQALRAAAEDLRGSAARAGNHVERVERVGTRFEHRRSEKHPIRCSIPAVVVSMRALPPEPLPPSTLTALFAWIFCKPARRSPLPPEAALHDHVVRLVRLAAARWNELRFADSLRVGARILDSRHRAAGFAAGENNVFVGAHALRTGRRVLISADAFVPKPPVSTTFPPCTSCVPVPV
jgi:hypothetical protein